MSYGYFSPYVAPIPTIEELIAKAEARIAELKKKCPPPRSWNGITKLPWRLNIFYLGQCFKDIIEYDLDQSRFTYCDSEGRAITITSRFFTVQRLT